MESAEDKYARRRAARRAAAEAERPVRPEHPSCLTASFVLWLVLGIGLLLVGIDALAASGGGAGGAPAFPLVLGLLVVVAALNLPAGFQGPRYVLSVVTVLTILSLRGLFLLPGWGVLIVVVLVGLSVAATVLMWLPAANEYVRALRQLPKSR